MFDYLSYIDSLIKSDEINSIIDHLNYHDHEYSNKLLHDFLNIGQNNHHPRKHNHPTEWYLGTTALINADAFDYNHYYNWIPNTINFAGYSGLAFLGYEIFDNSDTLRGLQYDEIYSEEFIPEIYLFRLHIDSGDTKAYLPSYLEDKIADGYSVYVTVDFVGTDNDDYYCDAAGVDKISYHLSYDGHYFIDFERDYSDDCLGSSNGNPSLYLMCRALIIKNRI